MTRAEFESCLLKVGTEALATSGLTMPVGLKASPMQLEAERIVRVVVDRAGQMFLDEHMANNDQALRWIRLKDANDVIEREIRAIERDLTT